MLVRKHRGAFVAGAIALVLLGTSCQWTLAGYDTANSNFNPSDTTLAVANVSGLHQEWATVGPGSNPSPRTPIVYDAKVFVSSVNGLAAYDAFGRTGCSGVPRVCAPLWTAPAATGQPFAYDGMIYVPDGSSVSAFDPDGVAGCSGTPTVCAPLSTTQLGIHDIVPAGGEVFGIRASGSGTEVAALDDLALDGCTGPCAPLRTYDDPSCLETAWLCATTSIAVEGDVLIVRGERFSGSYYGGTVVAYDRSGVRGCAGVPVTCTPLWSEQVGFGGVSLSSGTAVMAWAEERWDDGSAYHGLRVLDQQTGATRWTGDVPTDSFGAIAVGQGQVHVAVANELRTFPLATSCTTSCPPHHVAALTGIGGSAPVLANGVVFVGTTKGLQAFDAAGVAGCSGTPLLCAPLVTVPAPAGVAIDATVVALGNVWTIGSDGALRVYGLD